MNQRFNGNLATPLLIIQNLHLSIDFFNFTFSPFFNCDTQSSSTSVMSAQSKSSIFPKFAKLPIEIQFMIWKLAFPEPCIVHISNHATDAEGKKKELYSPWESRPKNSPLLCTSRDARQVFRREYVELKRIIEFEHKMAVFFAPKVDTLYLDVKPDILYDPTLNRRRNAAKRLAGDREGDGGPKSTITINTTENFPHTTQHASMLTNFEFLASSETLKSVRHLALEYKPWHRFCFEHKVILIMDFFPCFPGLDTFNFVFGDPSTCDIGEKIRHPLEIEDIAEGAFLWDYASKAKKHESRAFQEARRRDPSLAIPKFGFKALRKWKGKTENEFRLY